MVVSSVECVVRATAHENTLVVSRSVLVRDTDEVYAEVADFLTAHKARLVERTEARNVRYFGHAADVAVYALGVAA